MMKSVIVPLVIAALFAVKAKLFLNWPVREGEQDRILGWMMGDLVPGGDDEHIARTPVDALTRHDGMAAPFDRDKARGIG
jgi:hypothetical protein